MKQEHHLPRLSRASFLRCLALGTPLVTACFSRAEEPLRPEGKMLDMGNLRAFVELARSDIRTQKSLILAQNLPLTEGEAVEFWPVQREYELELNKLLDLRYAGIVEFFKNRAALTEAQAVDLADRAFNLEEKRTALKRRYFKKFRKVIPAPKAARFFQIENQLNMAIDLQIAAALPLIS